MAARILAPLRGVTIRAFRLAFAEPLRAGSFTEAITPFIPILNGTDPLADRELRAPAEEPLRLTPQVLTKDPQALEVALKRLKEAGYTTVDLNAGCPFPMVRNKGRGSGLLRTPDVLRRLLDVGCMVLGPNAFSVKTRLGVESPRELIKLVPILNEYPLRFVTLHARTARQMYTGTCHAAEAAEVQSALKVPFVANGDLPFSWESAPKTAQMIGRDFIRALGERADIGELLDGYLELSQKELSGEQGVLGRFKELIAYWKDLPEWQNRWKVLRLARTCRELRVW